MSIRRIIAVATIFGLACAGWIVLGTATAVRSTNFADRLGGEVEKLWGAPVIQSAPSVSFTDNATGAIKWVMPESNEIDVALETDYRRKGLIWYPTYVCSFDGTYKIRNDSVDIRSYDFHFDFPLEDGTYADFAIMIDGSTVVEPVNMSLGIDKTVEIQPGAEKTMRITYRTRGIREWRYRMDPNVGRVRNLDLTVRTAFDDVDYADGTLSPMETEEDDGAAVLRWVASDLITSEDVGIIIPEKLNPGPLTSRITFFAPVCLLFFFTLVATINILYRINIHPMHYMFVAAGFFAFHLLLAYMVDMINIHLSFAISALVSITLVTSYLSATLRGRLPLKVAIGGQFFFLVLFSYSFFMKGSTGLIVAIGSVVTLAVLMRVTAHLDWEDVFSRPPKKSTPPTLPATPDE